MPSDRSTVAPAIGLRERWRRLETRLPPARVLWIALAVLGTYGVGFFGNGVGAIPLLTLPILAALTDLGLQRYRFPSVRFPDSALATGLFLALILPPMAPLAALGPLAVTAVVLRHAARVSGRPWFNPAATGVLLGAAVFGLAPAWWGSINLELTLFVGGVVLLWNRRNWKLPVAFLGAYAGLTTLVHLMAASLIGTPANGPVLLLAALDPSVLFFGLFLVAEPRSAPSPRSIAQPFFGACVALGSALGLFLLPSLSGIATLLLANLTVAGVRWRSAGRVRRVGAGSGRALRGPSADRWTIPMRGTAVLAVLLLLGVAVPFAVVPGTPAVPLVSSGPPTGSAGGAASATACSHDSASVRAATLRSLHQALGPSVILSDDPTTGVVVFYDPVHQVTVTETDLYEDFGSAEFNGDDYAVAGCAP